MDGRHPLATHLTGILKRVANHVGRSLPRDELEAGAHIGRLEVFEAAVGVLDVLADHHQIDLFKAGLHARQGPHHPHIGEEAERLADENIDAPVTAANGRRGGPLEGHLLLGQQRERLVGDGVAILVDRGQAGVGVEPFDGHARGVEDAAHSLGDLGADAVAGQKNNLMLHERTVR